ncbi:MAG: hypothetical protein EOP53_14350 [Sphingobacteriales bacterium]|nr:MAG: hypothetical protein EOP53_14350 [Sphingobacteriales bacterium]
MYKRIFISFFFSGFAVLLYAQDYNVYDTTVKVETVADENYEEDYEEYSQVDTVLYSNAVVLEKDSINSWKRKKEFAYIKNLDSLLKASQEKEPIHKQRIPGGDSFATRLLGGPVIKIILWTLALFFVGIIVYQLLKNRGLFQRSSRSKVAEKPEDEDILLLHDDFEKLAQQAIAIGDYRMAVRYHFLKILQQLRDKNHISYEPDKTNARYVYELPLNWRNDFSKLIFQYEYVWYGHFDINQHQYEQVKYGFHSFLQKI